MCVGNVQQEATSHHPESVCPIFLTVQHLSEQDHQPLHTTLLIYGITTCICAARQHKNADSLSMKSTITNNVLSFAHHAHCLHKCANKEKTVFNYWYPILYLTTSMVYVCPLLKIVLLWYV